MMKNLRFALMSLLMVFCGSVFAEDIIWQEDWSGVTEFKSDPATFNAGSYSFTGTVYNDDQSFKSGTTFYIEALAGGEAPELLIAKNGGSFSARISLGGKTGEMMLAFKCNKNISVEISDGAELGEPTNTGNDYLYPVTVYAGTAQVTITFSNSLTSNARLDNIKLYQGSAKLPAGLSWGKSSTTQYLGQDQAFTLQNENQLPVTLTSSEESVATIGADGNIKFLATGKTVITASFAGNDEYEAQSVSIEVTVKSESGEQPGTDTPVAGDVISVAEALRIIAALEDGVTTDEEYQVKGYIVGAPDFQRKTDGSLYGNVNLELADEKGGSATITVYRGKDYSNENFTETTINRFKEGDQVVFQGKLQKFVQATSAEVTPELKYSWLISVNGNEAPVTIAMPVISPESQDYWEILEVTISCETEGATIYYQNGEEIGTGEPEWQEYTGSFYIGWSGTVCAKAVKDGVESEIAYATYNRITPPDPSEFEGDGSKENPYTVADLQKMHELHYPGGDIWVKGYIVGSIQNNKIDADQVSNIALASTADESEFANVIPVELKKGTDFRNNLNVVDNPGNIGMEVLVCGEITKYFGVTGVKNLSDYYMEGQPEVVAAPVFIPESSTFDKSITVTLRCVTEGATIMYSIENDASLEWQEYVEPIVLTETATIWAKAVKDGSTDSETVGATFTKNSGDVSDITKPYSHFTDKNLSVEDGELDWYASIDANGYESSGSNRGVQFGAGKGEFTLTSSVELYDVTRVTMEISTNATGNTIAVKVGETYFTQEMEVDPNDYFGTDTELDHQVGDDIPDGELGRKKAPEAYTYELAKENNQTLSFSGQKSSGKVTIEVNDANKSVYFKQIVIDGVIEVPTAVHTAKTADAAAAATYNLQGQRVQKAVRGLYIINGKKVLVK